MLYWTSLWKELLINTAKGIQITEARERQCVIIVDISLFLEDYSPSFSVVQGTSYSACSLCTYHTFSNTEGSAKTGVSQYACS